MTKLRIRVGSVEVDYEGPEEFIKSDLMGLIKAVSELRGSSTDEGNEGEGEPGEAGATDSSVSTVAQKMGVTKGPDLIVAAGYILSGGGKKSFEKKALRETIKTAQGFYKATYGDNFDAYVARLVKKGRLSHVGGNSYGMPASEISKLQPLLAK